MTLFAGETAYVVFENAYRIELGGRPRYYTSEAEFLATIAPIAHLERSGSDWVYRFAFYKHTVRVASEGSVYRSTLALPTFADGGKLILSGPAVDVIRNVSEHPITTSTSSIAPAITSG